MIRKWMVGVVLSGCVACWGCCACDHVDDYSGTYQGGVVGDWDGNAGRAGSAYAGAAAHEEAAVHHEAAVHPESKAHAKR